MRDDDHVANFGDATAVGGDFRGTTQPGTRGAAECWHLRHDTNTIHETTPDVPPFSAALSIPPSALPKITRRVPETEVFLKLARVARGLDLLQQMRRRRGPGSELLAQSYEVAKKKSKTKSFTRPDPNASLRGAEQRQSHRRGNFENAQGDLVRVAGSIC